MSLYCMARILRLDLLELQLAETHGRRGDERSQWRRVRDVPPVTWLPVGRDGDPLAVEQRYTEHVEGAFIPKGKGKALHLLVKFPKSVAVETTTDAESALKLAVDFAHEIFGDKSVFAARMDRDEKSLTNADVFIAPRYVKKTKHTEKEAISLSRHLKLMAEKRGPLPKDQDILRFQGQALQDAFSEFLRQRGYQALRGQKKEAPEPDRVSPEAYGVATDRKIAAADREVAAQDRAEIEDRLAAKERDLDQLGAALRQECENVSLTAQRMLEDAAEKGRRIVAEADDAAEAIRQQAEADAEKIRAAESERAEREAQTILNRARADAAVVNTAAEKMAAEARDRADEVKHAAEQDRKRIGTVAEEMLSEALVRGEQVERDALAVVDRERKIGAREQAVVAAGKAVELEWDIAHAAAVRAQGNADEADRRLARVKATEQTAEASLAAADRAKAEAQLASQQLALISRAMTEEALALIADESERGVSMNESVMNEREHRAYRARWSDLVRAIARSVAAALANIRAVLADAAKQMQKARTDAAGVQRDREALSDERANLNAKTVELGLDRRALRKEQAAVEAFNEAWTAIPEAERTPTVNKAIARARGVLAQVRDLPPEQGGRAKGGGKKPDLTTEDPRDRRGAGR